MRDNPKITVAPTLEPVTANEVKTFLKIDGNDEDVYILDLMTAARVMIENVLKRTLFTTTLTLTKKTLPNSYDYESEASFYDIASNEIYLPRGYVQSVTSVKYFDRAGASTIVPAADYTLVAGEKIILSGTSGWHTDTTVAYVEIEYIAGETTTDLIPRPIKNAILTLAAVMYNSRSCDCEMPKTMRAMLNEYRLPYYVRPRIITIQRG